MRQLMCQSRSSSEVLPEITLIFPFLSLQNQKKASIASNSTQVQNINKSVNLNNFHQNLFAAHHRDETSPFVLFSFLVCSDQLERFVDQISKRISSFIFSSEPKTSLLYQTYEMRCPFFFKIQTTQKFIIKKTK